MPYRMSREEFVKAVDTGRKGDVFETDQLQRDRIAELEAEAVKQRDEAAGALINSHLDHTRIVREYQSIRNEHESTIAGLRGRLESAEKDTARLDWLSSLTTEVDFWNKNGNRKCSLAIDVENSETLIEADDLRAAIDAAMQEPSKEQG